MIAWLTTFFVARFAVSTAVAQALAVVALLTAGAAAYGTWHYVVYSKGYAAADAEWREKNYEAQIEELKKQIEIQKEVDRFEDEAARKLEEERARLEKEVADYEKKLAERGDSCALDDDDINGLPKESGGH